jgi:hypothetical protein
VIYDRNPLPAISRRTGAAAHGRVVMGLPIDNPAL